MTYQIGSVLTVLYLWIKVAEPVLTEIAKAALKKRLPVANAAAAH